MKISVVNGPNLNFLGIREPEVYGRASYQDLVERIKQFVLAYDNVEVDFFQSNHEGAIIDYLQQCHGNQVDAILLNPGAYTHYSYAIRDCISAIGIKTIEVHLSDIMNREDFRKISVIAPVCYKRIYGKQLDSYIEALTLVLEEAGVAGERRGENK